MLGLVIMITGIITFVINDYMNKQLRTQIRHTVYYPGVTLNNFENITFINNQSHICRDDGIRSTFVVVVATQASRRELRHYVRDTWGSVRKYRSMTIHVVFFAGLSFSSHEDQKLHSDADKYRDIVITNQKDIYHHLTEKSVMMLKWANEFCNKARFILKTDDDCFNNLPKYVDFVLHSSLPMEFIGGNCIYDRKPHRLKKDKYYVSKESYPNTYYPGYCMGAAYIISRQAAIKIIKVSKYVKYVFIEDIYITGYCREAAEVSIISLSGIFMNNIRISQKLNCGFFDGVLTLHAMHPWWWQRAWKVIDPEKGLCNKLA